jgi:two-component system, chemotaxis family, sensor kinase CheA
MNDDTLEYLHGYVVEGRKMLKEADEHVTNMRSLLPNGNTDHDCVHQLFRSYHTLKGVSLFLNLNNISTLSESVEVYLDLLRNKKVKLSEEACSLFTMTIDFLLLAMDRIEKENTDAKLTDPAKKLIKRFTELSKGKNIDLPDTNDLLIDEEKAEFVEEAIKLEEVKKPEKKIKNDEKKVVPEEIVELESSNKQPVEETQSLDHELMNDPELLRQFVIEGEEIINQIEQDLLSFENSDDNLEFFNSIFRNFHSFKGNSGFFGFTDLEQICHKCETIFDFLRENPTSFSKAINSNFLSVISIIRNTINNINLNGNHKILSSKALLSVLDDLYEIVKSNNDTSGEMSEYYSVIVGTLVSMVEAEFIHNLESEYFAGEDEASVDFSDHKSEIVKRQTATQTIRIDTSKLDILLNLVGELVISQSMLSSSPDILSINKPLPIFDKRLNDLKKICREVQEASMAMRMLQIEPLFKKMIRLVRDVSNKSKKDVKIELRGGETEVDKNMIESLSDPLVHIIRNAVDHGIESPEEREKVGKNPIGKIILEALHANGEVWIRISDDGAGLDKKKILKKAISKDLASEDIEYKDEDIYNFIFLPGFSTADEISNISGRGVGMDVVYTELQALSGRVRIQSERGVGTTFTLSIPLTMAILDGMVVDVDKRFYAIPIASVQETFQYKVENILRLSDGTELVQVRENHYKVFHLSKYYKTGNVKKKNGILMLIAHDEHSVCVYVDEIIGQQQIVLKPLPNYIGHIKSISGCAILSGGELSMVLDTRELIMDTL